MLPHRERERRVRATITSVKALLTAMSCQKGELEANTRRHIALLEEGAAAWRPHRRRFPRCRSPARSIRCNWPGQAVRSPIRRSTAVCQRPRAGSASPPWSASRRRTATTCTSRRCSPTVVAVVGHYRKRTLGDGRGVVSARFGHRGVHAGIDADRDRDLRGRRRRRAVRRRRRGRRAGRVLLLRARPLRPPDRRSGLARGFDWWTGSALGDAARHARRHGLWIALSTQAGATADEDFPGLAALVDPNGDVVDVAPRLARRHPPRRPLTGSDGAGARKTVVPAHQNRRAVRPEPPF